MAVGAHTGDAQLTCGMLLAKQAMLGDKVILVDLTAGERGAPPNVEVSEFRKRNVDSAQRFAKAIGGESIVFDVPDGELYAGQEIELQLAQIMREHKVDGVLYHWQNSLHKDHVQAHLIAQRACFFAALPTYPHELPPAPIRNMMCAENWEDEEDFKPYFYFDVSEAFPKWKEAIKMLWLAENSLSFKYLRYYEALAITRGARIKADYATCFGIADYAKRQVIQSL